MIRFRTLLVVAGAIAGAAASPVVARAQFPADVQAGARVRVWIPEQHRQEEGPARRQLLRGTIEGVTPDTLRLAIPNTAGTIAIPRASVRRLELSNGSPSRAANAFERGAAGAIGGAILWALLNDPRREGGPSYRTDWRAAGVGAAWGAAFGAAAGLLWPHERWRRVRLAR